MLQGTDEDPTGNEITGKGGKEVTNEEENKLLKGNRIIACRSLQTASRHHNYNRNRNA